MKQMLLTALMAVVAIHGWGQTSATVLRTIPNPAPAQNAAFGFTIATRGRDFAVAAYGAPQGPLEFAGAAYVYPRGGDAAVALVSPQPGNDFLYGYSSLINGQSLFVGEPQSTVTAGRQGRVHVYDMRRLTEAPRTIESPFPSTDYATFGVGLAVSGKTLFVGDPFIQSLGPGNTSGAVGAMNRTTGDLLFTLLPPAPQAFPIGNQNGLFGYAAAANRKQLAVGSPAASVSPAYPNTGSAHLFSAKAGKGGVAPGPQMLVPPPTPQQFQSFGYSATACGPDFAFGGPTSADIDSGQNIVSNVGRVVVVLARGGTVVLAPPAADAGGECLFGVAVAGDKRFLYVGAPLVGGGLGVVYVYDRTRGYSLVKAIYGPDFLVPGDTPLFGYSVAVYGKNLLVAAPGKNFGPFTTSGVVYEVPGITKDDLK